MYKVLIVDSNKSCIDLIKDRIVMKGNIVDTVLDTIFNKEIDILEYTNIQYDYIVVDIDSPNVDISTICKMRLKNPYAIFLIYTKCVEVDIMIALINIGIDGYFSKGNNIDFNNLISIITDERWDEYAIE